MLSLPSFILLFSIKSVEVRDTVCMIWVVFGLRKEIVTIIIFFENLFIYRCVWLNFWCLGFTFLFHNKPTVATKIIVNPWKYVSVLSWWNECNHCLNVRFFPNFNAFICDSVCRLFKRMKPKLSSGPNSKKIMFLLSHGCRVYQMR